jgi:hypothetical protein
MALDSCYVLQTDAHLGCSDICADEQQQGVQRRAVDHT